MRLGAPFPRRRAPSLTPMIDVVFLLLVFFMLAARFGAEGALPLAGGGGSGAGWQGPPRLVVVAADGLRLNGVAVDEGALAGALRGLGAGTVVLRPERATIGRLVAVAGGLRAAGIDRLVVVE